MKKRESDIIEQTIDFWSKRTGKRISPEDARQMVENMSGFFQVLADWDQKAQKEDEESKANLVKEDQG